MQLESSLDGQSSAASLNDGVIKVPYNNSDLDFPAVTTPQLEKPDTCVYATSTTSALVQTKISYADVVLSEKVVKQKNANIFQKNQEIVSGTHVFWGKGDFH